jgi:hypothetical protein
MSWIERDGPVVVSPKRNGFGSIVIGKMVQMSFDCKPTADYAQSGFSWRLDCAAEKVMEENQPGIPVDRGQREIAHPAR